MLSYVIRRLLLMIPTLVGITLVVFLIMALSPGSVATSLRSAEGDMRPEDRRRVEQYVRKRYGLDQPLLVQYGRWLNQLLPVGFKYPGTAADLPRLRARFDAYRAQGLPPQEALDEVDLRDSYLGELLALDAQGQLVPQAERPGVGLPETARFGLKPPDLGESFVRRRPVLDVILDALPITLLLNVITIPIIYAISIASGIYAARRRGGVFDVASGVVYLALYSMPAIWIGTMLLGFFASRDYHPWFPTGGLHDTLAGQMRYLPAWVGGRFERGWLLDACWHLVLPIICLTYGGFAFLSKLMRSSILENVTADFARTARAKGLAENVILYRHVLSNSVLPLITVAASILPGLLGGALIVETIFSINGMGRVMIEAIKMKDQELVLSETCVVAVVSLVSLIVADVLYAMADPRVAYE
jgi:peptide/nickel transport system permease protein